MDTAYRVRKAESSEIGQIEGLLEEWLGPYPRRSRSESIADAVAKGEVLVAASASGVLGFIHYGVHNDVVDGAPNAFITAFCVRASRRRMGIGASLLDGTIADARRRGAVSVEASTTRSGAKRFYERRGFRQPFGDIGETFLELDLVGAVNPYARRRLSLLRSPKRGPR